MNLAVFDGTSQKLFRPMGTLRSKNFPGPSIKNIQNPRPCSLKSHDVSIEFRFWGRGNICGVRAEIPLPRRQK